MKKKRRAPSAGRRRRGRSREPAVLRRLPPEVEYTRVKMIVHSVPPWLTTITWAAQVDDPIWAAFRGKPYRTLDRALRKRELACKGLRPRAAAKEHQRLMALRHEFVQQFLGEINHPNRRGTRSRKWISVRHVDPSRFLPQFRPSYLRRPGLVIEVWVPGRDAPKLLERRVVESGPSPWGKPKVNWVDPERVNRTCTEVFRRHFPDLMQTRVGHHWRSHRSPEGWPLITRHAVPALYDYLRPFYSVRKYPANPAGLYPAQLRRDITDILRCELPHVSRELTVERVTAAIQRHVRRAPPTRPQGRNMFPIPIPSAKNR